jgi:hypothetical protein
MAYAMGIQKTHRSVDPAARARDGGLARGQWQDPRSEGRGPGAGIMAGDPAP